MRTYFAAIVILLREPCCFYHCRADDPLLSCLDRTVEDIFCAFVEAFGPDLDHQAVRVWGQQWLTSLSEMSLKRVVYDIVHHKLTNLRTVLPT